MNDDSFCFSHDRLEAKGSHPYRICANCHHVFGTAQDLVDAHNVIVDSENRSEKVRRYLGGRLSTHRTVDTIRLIYVCPYCRFDWS